MIYNLIIFIYIYCLKKVEWYIIIKNKDGINLICVNLLIKIKISVI